MVPRSTNQTQETTLEVQFLFVSASVQFSKLLENDPWFTVWNSEDSMWIGQQL